MVKKILLSTIIILCWFFVTTTIQAEDKTENFKSESFYEDDGALVVDIVIYFLRDPSTLTTKSMSVDYVDKYTIENTNSCLLYTTQSPRDLSKCRKPSSA